MRIVFYSHQPAPTKQETGVARKLIQQYHPSELIFIGQSELESHSLNKPFKVSTYNVHYFEKPKIRLLKSFFMNKRQKLAPIIRRLVFLNPDLLIYNEEKQAEKLKTVLKYRPNCSLKKIDTIE